MSYLSLPRLPSRRDAARWMTEDLRADALAGLTVAVMGVPQAMAYAMIADLPPVYGLHTAIVTCIVAALLGSSSHLVTGPTNATCMVLLSLTIHTGATHGLAPFEIVLLITLLAGLVQLAFGLLRLGGIVRYVSNSVIVGFTAGAGILIAVNQLKNILGIDLPAGHGPRFHQVLIETLRMVPETNPRALAVALVTAIVVLVSPRIHRRIPGALLGIALTGGIGWALGWHRPEAGLWRLEIVRDIEPIRANLLTMLRLPELVIHPRLGLIEELLPGVLAVAILGLVEGASIARTVASSTGQRLDFSRQFAAQGASNIVGSFFSCFVGSGSFTRTAVCWRSGGRTRMAAVFSAIWTALTVLLLAPVANFIPKAALAGILVVVAYTMVEKQRVMMTWRSGRNSRYVLVGTLAATLIMPLEYAIFVGVFLSVVILLRITGHTDLTHLVARTDSGFDEVPFQKAAPSPVVTINMEGDLYFAAVDDLDYQLLRGLTPQTKVVVLRMKRLRAVGSTAMAILEHFWKILGERGIRLVVCGIEDELEEVLTKSGLRRQIGEQNIFYADNKLFQSTELAHARAWSLADSKASRRDAADAIAGVEAPGSTGVTAGDIMSTRVIRFGVQHQVREAVWLMSEMQKHDRAPGPQPLCLQDREGRLAAELTMGALVREMMRGLETQDLEEKEDHEIGLLLRDNFVGGIREIARTDLPKLGPEATLGELLRASVGSDLAVLPILDGHGRVVGLVDPDDLLAGLATALDASPPKEDRDDA